MNAQNTVTFDPICDKVHEAAPMQVVAPAVESPEHRQSLVEIHVRAHRRIVQRKKYIPECRYCPRPNIICAPAAARGYKWSGRLAAVLFSIFQALGLFNFNPRRWLQMYLQACSENAGKAPEDIETFLPWNMTGSDFKQILLAK